MARRVYIRNRRLCVQGRRLVVGTEGADPDCVCGDDPVGACCLLNGECTVVTQSACSSLGGRWLGPDTSCQPYPCGVTPDPACCIPPAFQCTGGVWLPNFGTNICVMPPGYVQPPFSFTVPYTASLSGTHRYRDDGNGGNPPVDVLVTFSGIAWQGVLTTSSPVSGPRCVDAEALRNGLTATVTNFGFAPQQTSVTPRPRMQSSRCSVSPSVLNRASMTLAWGGYSGISGNSGSGSVGAVINNVGATVFNQSIAGVPPATPLTATIQVVENACAFSLASTFALNYTRPPTGSTSGIIVDTSIQFNATFGPMGICPQQSGAPGSEGCGGCNGRDGVL